MQTYETASESEADHVDIMDVFTHGNLSVRLGGGSDTLNITSGFASDNILLDAGDGGDTVHLSFVTAVDQFYVNMGAGADVLTLDFIFAHNLALLGGSGTDRLSRTSHVFYDAVYESGWEPYGFGI